MGMRSSAVEAIGVEKTGGGREVGGGGWKGVESVTLWYDRTTSKLTGGGGGGEGGGGLEPL